MASLISDKTPSYITIPVFMIFFLQSEESIFLGSSIVKYLVLNLLIVVEIKRFDTFEGGLVVLN